MHNTQEVLKAAQTAQEGRLKSQPVWVRELVADLVLRLTYEARRASDAVLLPSHPSAVRIEAR